MNDTNCTKAKALLREIIRRRAGELSERERHVSDEALLFAFLNCPELVRARSVLLFYGVGTEPNTARLLPVLLALNYRVCFPRCLPDRQMEAREVTELEQLVPGQYGIPEPILACPRMEPKDIDLILVPGLCFDASGGRLGQGGGYYDRYLAEYHGKTVSLCRDILLQEKIPREVHDKGVDLVLTETQIFYSAGNGGIRPL